MKVSRIDHLVLTVKDIDKTVEFYQRALGMNKITFGENRVALTFGNQKINLHQWGHEFEPKAKNVQPGSADLCFILKIPVNDAVDHLTKCGVEVLEGPVSRMGATGNIVSAEYIHRQAIPAQKQLEKELSKLLQP